jgi:myo-inositol-1(or 4)-monophosphatase
VTAAGDREVAERAASAAGAAALARVGTALDVGYKLSGADPVTDADREAEAAAVAVLRAERPGDAVTGEEGTDAGPAGPAGAGRRWFVDGLDGTTNYAAGIPHWCVAVVLEDDEGPLACAVEDPLRGERFSAARGEGAAITGPGGRRAVARVRDGRPLDRAVVTTFLRPDRLDALRAGALAAGLVARTGGLRMAGSGSLDLAWVAAGRLDAWIQPDPDPWDWLPGRLLVEEAGGAVAVAGSDPAWHVAGPCGLLDDVVALLPGVYGASRSRRQPPPSSRR